MDVSRVDMGLFFSSGPSKMSVVKDNSKQFVETLHKKGTHLGAVSQFDSSYTVGTARKSPKDVKSDIDDLSTGGKTALYDSVLDSMERLRIAQKTGRAPIPALLLTFTDGKENKSDASLDTVKQKIKQLGFVPRNGCYFAIAGIGSASQKELEEICAKGRGIYTHTDDDIREAFGLFLAATLAVIEGRQSYKSIRKNEKKMSYRKLERRFKKRGVIPMQYMLNIDTSGSMSNSP